jgi:osmotically-inducible protein OsmY
MVTANLAADPADRELECRVYEYLAERRVQTLRALEVEARRGRVTLRGRVGSFYEKQLAIHCLYSVDGVRRLVDDIDVADARVVAALS